MIGTVCLVVLAISALPLMMGIAYTVGIWLLILSPLLIFCLFVFKAPQSFVPFEFVALFGVAFYWVIDAHKARKEKRNAIQRKNHG